MNIESVICYAISAPDKPGEAARFSSVLREEGVDLSGMWAFSLGGGKAQIIVVPKQADKFKVTAQRAGINAQPSHCFHIYGDDRVGALVDILERVAGLGVNLHALDAIVVDGQFGCYLWTEEDDVEKVRELLGVHK